MDKAARFALFIETLEGAPPAASFETARALIDATLNGIEDVHSGVAFDPVNWESDGRLYPPVDPYRADAAAGVRVTNTVSHRVRIGANGAIRIERFAEVHGPRIRVELDKPGRDGAQIAVD